MSESSGQDRGQDWRRRGVLSGITLAFYAIGAVWFAPRFETMDDVAMAMWSSGLCLSPQPSGHIIFSHQIFGGVLAALYTWLPAIAWYGWAHLAVMFAADLAIGSVLLRSCGWWRGIPAYLVFLLYAQTDAFVQMQFTKTAFYATLAGLLLLADAAPGAPDSRRRLWSGCALGFIGSLVRFESFVFACVVALPALVFWWTRRAETGARPRLAGVVRLAIFVGIPLAVAGITAVTDRLGEWKHYYDYRLYRSRALDFGDHMTYNAQTKPVFDEIGWTENHLAMFQQYSFYDGQVFSEEKLGRLLQAFPRRFLADDFGPKARRFFRSLGAPEYFPLIGLTLLIGLLARTGRTRGVLAILWLSAAGLLTGILLTLKWPPHRVIQPVLAVALVFSCWLVLSDFAGDRRWRSKAAVVLLVAAGFFRIGTQWPVLLHEAARARAQTRGALGELAALADRGDRLYFVWANCFPYVETFLPFDHHRDLFQHHFQLGSWGIYIPHSDEMRRRFGIDQPYRALVDNPAMYFLSRPEGGAQLGRFLHESYGINVEVEPASKGKLLLVWRVRSIPAPNPSPDRRS